MGRRRRQKEPVELTLDRLDAKGVSGPHGTGRLVVRAGAVGATLRVRPGRKQKADRLELISPAPDQVKPACPAFGSCGGCQLQEMPLSRQRSEKAALVGRLVGHPCHDCTGAPQGLGYRNKLELSFAARRYLVDPPTDRETLVGSWLGLHPPGWHSRVVDLQACPLGSPEINTVIAAVRDLHLAPPWDGATRTGWWRHLVLRQGDDGVLVTLVTHPDCPLAAMQAVAEHLDRLDCVSGVRWLVNDGVADVATGQLRGVLAGTDHLSITLPATPGSENGTAGTPIHLPADAFFQVNSAGAAVLFERIADALGLADHPGGTLLDLYCGVGAIGLHLARRVDRVVGIELLDSAVQIARDNAAANDLAGEWHAGAVEDILASTQSELSRRLMDLPAPWRVVVDPPRVGLHPRAAQFLATLDADVLVYVACNPASLGRDRIILEAGGWILTDLWAVDMFPQTRHIEAVGRFVRGVAVRDNALPSPLQA
ncbi:MAG: class I SAM-dependent RNA methyltransferase [Oligoflexia bacterium]|nr:class I SAM-dependent RNA methyltransferase [Oligoflexia bacterium]